VSEIWLVEPDATQPYRKIFSFQSAASPRSLTWTRDNSSLIVASQEYPGDIVMFDVTQPK
jgi:hypothetical protein